MARDETQFRTVLTEFAAAEACANALAKALTISESELTAAMEVINFYFEHVFFF